MPGWHKATEDLQTQGKVKMLGIIQEQHPDRARLFMQWKQMGWPIMVDALNLLGVSVVPITLLIDEFGVITKVNPRRSDTENEIEEFLGAKVQRSENASAKSKNRKSQIIPGKVESSAHEYANNLILWENPKGIDSAILAYNEALSETPDNGPLHFRLGVAHRLRYDLLTHQPDDFQSAVEHWVKALEIDPNQYIWRRRIQQYGPRLDKPYPFYDWIDTARREINERGERPIDLVVEPGGAEYAKPLKTFQNENDTPKEPDPGGLITKDNGQFITVHSVVVHSTNKNNFASRIHIEFTPNKKAKAHWNNEVDDLEFWIEPPEGWRVNSRKITTTNPTNAVSQETRRIEFELKSPQEPTSNSITIPGYALYYVCEDLDGTCLYRRQDVLIKLDL